MWTSAEDGARYFALTREIIAALARRAGPQNLAQVEVADLATYLEWFELAREVAPTLKPFAERSSPNSLGDYSYRDLTRDFVKLRALLSQTNEAVAVL